MPFNLIDICLKSGGLIAIGGLFVTPVEVDFVFVFVVGICLFVLCLFCVPRVVHDKKTFVVIPRC